MSPETAEYMNRQSRELRANPHALMDQMAADFNRLIAAAPVSTLARIDRVMPELSGPARADMVAVRADVVRLQAAVAGLVTP